MAEGTPISSGPDASTPTSFTPSLVPSGEDLGRIVSLSDGVFAFALTLLVLSLTVPVLSFPAGTHPSDQEISGRLGAALQNDYVAFLGYAFAFFLIANWWLVHHRMFSSIRRYDSTLVGLNMIILLEVAVMPFVLSVYSAYSDTQVAVILFAASQAATGSTFALLWWWATENHRLVDKGLSAELVRYTRMRGLVAPIVFGASIAVSFVSLGLAEVFWIFMFIGPRIVRRAGYR